MDEDRLRNLYSTLLFDTKSEKRSEALKQLSAAEDRHTKTLAQIGSFVSNLLHNSGEVETLDNALDAVNALPMIPFWREFAETSAYAILLHSEGADEPDQSKLVDYGFQMMHKALNGGMFPLSDIVLRLMDKIAQKHPEYLEQARSMKELSERNKPSIEDPYPKKDKSRKAKQVRRKRKLGRRR